jgi:hypothetical protein
MSEQLYRRMRSNSTGFRVSLFCGMYHHVKANFRISRIDPDRRIWPAYPTGEFVITVGGPASVGATSRIGLGVVACVWAGTIIARPGTNQEIPEASMARTPEMEGYSRHPVEVQPDNG